MEDLTRQIRIVKIAADLCTATILLCLEACLVMLFLTGTFPLWPIVIVLICYAVGCACFLVVNTVLSWLKPKLREYIRNDGLYMLVYIVSSSALTLVMLYHIVMTHVTYLAGLTVHMPELAYDHMLGLGIGIFTAGTCSALWRTIKDLGGRDLEISLNVLIRKFSGRGRGREDEDDVVVIS